MPTLQSLLASVARKTVPSQEERKRMDRVSSRLESDVRRILDGHEYDADVSIQGSVARDTWLCGEADLDIFAAFPQTLDRDRWNRGVIPQLKRGLRKYKIIERYAEHPFLEFHTNGIRVNVVPCYKVNRGEWRSATDRTPYHTEYMKAHLTSEMRSEVRLLKKFMKGIGVYGAEIRIGGFSGMLTETLILHYKSFVQTLKEAGHWNNRVLIQVEKGEETKPKAHLDTQLVVVDPVDPNRNLAAAVRIEKLWSFVAASREFLRIPSLEYFYPPDSRKHSASKYNGKLTRSGDIVAVMFPHPPLVVDVLWGQLLSLEKSLVGLLQRFDFRLVKSQAWSDERKLGVMLLELEGSQLPNTRIHLGPPVSRSEESASFLKRHSGSASTVSGPFVQNDRWVVEKQREFPSASELLRSAFKNSNLGLSVPSQLQRSIRSKAHVIDKEGIAKLASNPLFAETLWDFLDGRPRWLRPRRS